MNDLPQFPYGLEVIARESLAERYLDLLKRALTRSFDDRRFDVIPANRRTVVKWLRYSFYQAVQRVLRNWGLLLVQRRAVGETMADMHIINNLHACLIEVQRNAVPGDFIETGVWRGGLPIFMRGFLLAHGDTERQVWVADSFEGLPKPSGRYAADAGDKLWQSESLAVSLEEVKGNFAKYGLLDERVTFLKGFFSDTIPHAPIDRLALLRLDGDMYESTIVVLEHLYPRLSPGGYVIIDDYGMVPSCDLAVDDYRRSHAISEPMRFIIGVNDYRVGVFWRKP